MLATTLIQVNLPNDVQDAANEVIQAAGLTVSEIVQRLMQRIAEHHAVPQVLLYPAAENVEAQHTQREQAIEEFKALRNRLRIAPTSIEEIIAWRDEGRR